MAEKKSILLRLNPVIWEEINKWAEDEFRSVNGQIEYLLNEAVLKRKKSLRNVLESGAERKTDKENE